ncbi:hypothetical protein HK096_011051 [Nowakowskiella sp. JEL0078]|nr:hypothetical protein HK096_011051 [Nowakowskiella sp. JEL0078]
MYKHPKHGRCFATKQPYCFNCIRILHASQSFAPSKVLQVYFSTSTHRLQNKNQIQSLKLETLQNNKNQKFEIEDSIRQLAKSRIETKISISDMIQFGFNPSPTILLNSALFLSDEVALRLARRYIELESLPYGIAETEIVLKVKGWYAKSFTVGSI